MPNKSVNKKLYLLLFCLLTACDGFKYEKSKGYVGGKLESFSISGALYQTGEGKLLIGDNSVSYFRIMACGFGQVSCKEEVNPWYFTSSDKLDILREKVGQYVIIQYTKKRPINFVTDSDNVFVDVLTIGDKIEGTCIKRKELVYSNLMETAEITGRIVQLYKKRNEDKFNMVFQHGETRNLLQDFKTDDEQLYKCSLGFLKSAQKVKMMYHNNSGVSEILEISPAL